MMRCSYLLLARAGKVIGYSCSGLIAKKIVTSGVNALDTCTCLCIVQFSSGCQGKHTSRQRNAGAAGLTMKAQLAAG